MKHLKLLKGLRIVLIATICLQVVLLVMGFEKMFNGRFLFGTVEVIINFLMMMLNFHSISRIKKILKDG